MDIILDANAYIGVLYNHGRTFFQTNQFAELLTYLRRTGSRLVIPELTYNEVVARYRDRLTAVTKTARDAWSTLQQVGMKERIDFLEPDIESELLALCELLNHPASGVQAVIYSDYSGIDVKEVAQRGIGRRRPANEKGEELRDVILWLIALQYAARSKTRVAFISGDKTFQDEQDRLHPTLLRDIEQAGVNITFYTTIRNFVTENALETQPIEQEALAAYIRAEELRGISTEQLLGSRFWDGTIVGAEVSQCGLAKGQRYRVGEDSYYVEARYTGGGTIRLARAATISVRVGDSLNWMAPQVPTAVVPRIAVSPPTAEQNFLSGVSSYGQLLWGWPTAYRETPLGMPSVAPTSEHAYRCSFSLRLSLRIAGDKRESLEVDEFVLLGELTAIPLAAL